MTQKELNFALLLAAKSGSVLEVNQLLDDGADACCQNGSHSTPLAVAAFYNNAGIVTALLKRAEVDVDAINIYGWTALMKASRNGPESALVLIERANVNAQNHKGYTALMLASMNGQAKTVQCLLENGADINIENMGGKALDYALQHKRFDVIKVIEDFVQAKESLRSEGSGSELMSVFGGIVR